MVKYDIMLTHLLTRTVCFSYISRFVANMFVNLDIQMVRQNNRKSLIQQDESTAVLEALL